jgi:hypothetical protein
MLSRLPATAPLFTADGSVDDDEVSRWVFFETRRSSSEVTAVSLESQTKAAGKGRRLVEWRVPFTLPSGAAVPALDGAPHHRAGGVLTVAPAGG